MSFFKNIFSSPGANEPQPEVKFGRYSDGNKKYNKTHHWTKSVDLFAEKKYMESYKEFFTYLNNDEDNSVNIVDEGKKISFSISQGSKVIKGYADTEKVVAETNIASFEKANIAFMRKLMNMNFALQYSRLALKDNFIAMKFTSQAIDASPNKLYYSLQELVRKADRQDNVLLDEFKMLKPIDVDHVVHVSEKEKEVKYKYALKWINETIKRTKELDQDKFYGIIAYMWLNLAYRLDYLIAPEEMFRYDLENIYNLYYAKDGKSYQEKNVAMLEGFEKIAAKPKEYFYDSFYKVKATFGVASPTAHATLVDFVVNDYANVKWYLDNKYPDMAAIIYEHSLGYCLFNFGMHRASTELCGLYLQIVNQDYITELGFKQVYKDASGKLNQSAIEDRIRAIVNKESKEFPKIDVHLDELKYTSILDFAPTFIKEIEYLNYAQ